MIKIWLTTSCYEPFFYKELEEKKFNVKFGHYKKKKMSDNEYLIYVPFDVYQYYFKS